MDEGTLTRLLEVGRGLLSELDHDAVLRRVLDVARELTDAEFAAIGVLDEDHAGLENFVTSGMDDRQRASIGDLPRGHGVLGVLITEPRPLRLDDVGHHPRSYGFPLNHPPMTTFLGVPIVVRGEVWGNLYLCDKAGGSPFTDTDEEAMVVLADWAAIAIANARLYQSAMRRSDELTRTVRALETTTEIAAAISGEVDLDRILELLVKRGRALVTARMLIVGLVAGGEIEVAAAAGEVPAGLIGTRLPLEESGVEEVLRTRRPVRCDEVLRRRGLLAIAGFERQGGFVVPLQHRGTPIGMLAAFDPLGAVDTFSADDIRLLQAFAGSAATAVATAQAFRSRSLERSIRASEDERSRWARELHDETLQELGALRILLGSARRGEDVTTVWQTIDDAIGLVTDGIAHLRSLITDLRPAALDEMGTEAALRALAERVTQTSGLPVHLDVDLDFEAGRADDRHAPELEEAVYRLVQEALTNVVKHAGAGEAWVVIRDADVVSVLVRDDGDGFDSGAATAGFGLLGMQERVALLAGRLEVRSEPGAGTTIDARFPRRRRSRHAQAATDSAASPSVSRSSGPSSSSGT